MVKEIEINGFTIRDNEDSAFPGFHVLCDGIRIAEFEHINSTHIGMRTTDNQRGSKHVTYWNKKRK